MTGNRGNLPDNSASLPEDSQQKANASSIPIVDLLDGSVYRCQLPSSQNINVTEGQDVSSDQSSGESRIPLPPRAHELPMETMERPSRRHNVDTLSSDTLPRTTGPLLQRKLELMELLCWLQGARESEEEIQQKLWACGLITDPVQFDPTDRAMPSVLDFEAPADIEGSNDRAKWKRDRLRAEIRLIAGEIASLREALERCEGKIVEALRRPPSDQRRLGKIFRLPSPIRRRRSGKRASIANNFECRLENRRLRGHVETYDWVLNLLNVTSSHATPNAIPEPDPVERQEPDAGLSDDKREKKVGQLKTERKRKEEVLLDDMSAKLVAQSTLLTELLPDREASLDELLERYIRKSGAAVIRPTCDDDDSDGGAANGHDTKRGHYEADDDAHQPKHYRKSNGSDGAGDSRMMIGMMQAMDLDLDMRMHLPKLQPSFLCGGKPSGDILAPKVGDAAHPAYPGPSLCALPTQVGLAELPRRDLLEHKLKVMKEAKWRQGAQKALLYVRMLLGRGNAPGNTDRVLPSKRDVKVDASGMTAKQRNLANNAILRDEINAVMAEINDLQVALGLAEEDISGALSGFDGSTMEAVPYPAETREDPEEAAKKTPGVIRQRHYDLSLVNSHLRGQIAALDWVLGQLGVECPPLDAPVAEVEPVDLEQPSSELHGAAFETEASRLRKVKQREKTKRTTTTNTAIKVQNTELQSTLAGRVASLSEALRRHTPCPVTRRYDGDDDNWPSKRAPDVDDDAADEPGRSPGSHFSGSQGSNPDFSESAMLLESTIGWLRDMEVGLVDAGSEGSRQDDDGSPSKRFIARDALQHHPPRGPADGDDDAI
ncbi:hypothetical protein J8273_6866 [Carpediemonas membranifera]|uniref:Uncharacterized protein n=1 Tax=Carpediemonas membranifera TaxID=201153 RepID=A0A8J6E091_9EUKA|nr:hypothetical protein J8273_6866 [Carpediemonas membranifera]|eukprot:KAG9391853.1 hypothetical protein J8273_6866 [Carpediemonas membranifera]